VLELTSAILGAVQVFFLNRRDVAIEILALRRQPAVFKRKHPRPKISSFDRLFWTILRRIWSGGPRPSSLLSRTAGCAGLAEDYGRDSHADSPDTERESGLGLLKSTASFMLDGEKAVKAFESQRRYGEEIKGHDHLAMISRGCEPALKWAAPWLSKKRHKKAAWADCLLNDRSLRVPQLGSTTEYLFTIGMRCSGIRAHLQSGTADTR
jgi:hypothetical protein